MENSIEIRFESLRVKLDKVEDILLKKIDSFENEMITNDNSFKVRFEFPRHSDFMLLRIGLLIFDKVHERINFEFSNKLTYRSESVGSIREHENVAKFKKSLKSCKNHIYMDHFHFLSYFFS